MPHRHFFRTLYVLLGTLLACFGGPLHTHGPVHVSGASTYEWVEPRLSEGAEGALVDVPAQPDHCHEPGPASLAQPSARLLPLALSAAPGDEGADTSVACHSATARRAAPGVGRAALNSLCRWRI
ncbi:hypothetical protein [Streptomyces sp. NPDC058308]|uniref:hypothetical protein n=1 Tax=Streptomyces sp. NPDC058308 TaxID=3346440 RepID=UPI0036EFA55F